MADRILVSTPEMEIAIQKYENARSELQDAYSKLDSAKSHLDNCYKGPAYMALCARWASIYMNVRTADNAIDESVNGLRKTISTMETGEQNVSTALPISIRARARRPISDFWRAGKKG